MPVRLTALNLLTNIDKQEERRLLKIFPSLTTNGLLPRKMPRSFAIETREY